MEEKGPDKTFFKESFLRLKEYRILCNAKILQIVLHFLGYTKEEINISKTNILNWNLVRRTLLNDENFFNKLEAYDFRGPKGAVKSYQMTNYLLDLATEMEKGEYHQEEVDRYNLGYGRIWQWFRYVLECRVKDIQLRREKKQFLREAREEAQEKHEDWDQRRQEAMEIAIEEKEAEVEDRKKEKSVLEKDR